MHDSRTFFITHNCFGFCLKAESPGFLLLMGPQTPKGRAGCAGLQPWLYCAVWHIPEQGEPRAGPPQQHCRFQPDNWAPAFRKLLPRELLPAATKAVFARHSSAALAPCEVWIKPAPSPVHTQHRHSFSPKI